MLVKNAHKGYPKKMLSDLSIPQGGGSLFNDLQVIAQGSEICKSRTLFELVEQKYVVIQGSNGMEHMLKGQMLDIFSWNMQIP